jgi:hypothetical protein
MECKRLFPNVLGLLKFVPRNHYGVISLALGHFVFHYSIAHNFVQSIDFVILVSISDRV